MVIHSFVYYDYLKPLLCYNIKLDKMFFKIQNIKSIVKSILYTKVACIKAAQRKVSANLNIKLSVS